MVISTRSDAATGRCGRFRVRKSLGPDGQAIAVPIQDLDAIAALVDEDKEMTGEGVERQAARCQGGQAVEAFDQFEVELEGSDRRGEIGKDGNDERVVVGTSGSAIVAVVGLRRLGLVEALSEWVK